MRVLAATVSMIVAGTFSASLSAQQPYTKPDDSWISISGTVESVSPDHFILDYGDGLITVEMDDGDRDADAYKLLSGDNVTVYGLIDDDFFEATTIEASSVYVENIGTYFYASAVDEEDTFVSLTTPIVASTTVIQGKVTEVGDDSFTLGEGVTALEVEVDEMTYDPLDDEGYQKISKGDRVSVSGTVDNDLFEGLVFDADTVVTLKDASEQEE